MATKELTYEEAQTALETARAEVEEAAAAVREAEVEAHQLNLAPAAASAHISSQTSRLRSATAALKDAEQRAAETAVRELPDEIGAAKRRMRSALSDACTAFSEFVQAVDHWHESAGEASRLTSELRSANKELNGRASPGAFNPGLPWRRRGSIPGDLRARVAAWAEQFAGLIMAGQSVDPDRVKTSQDLRH